MNIFYAPDINADSVVLDDAESKHAVQVLRMKAGDEVMMMNGKGGRFNGVIADPHPKRCSVKITSSAVDPRPVGHLHIAIAPTKMNDRMEWFLEKATEIGIQSITPVICDRSERRQINHDRFQKILISAMKQSMNSWLPILNEEISFSKFMDVSAPGFIAHCLDDEKDLLWKKFEPSKSIVVLIGPEGDFSQHEIELAISKGWHPVSLGKSRIRTETAGVMVCAAYAMR